MNDKLYNQFYDKLLFKAKNILYKFNCKLFNEYDVVNGSWDFKNENYKEVVNKMYDYVAEINKGKEINVSRFNKNRNSGDGEIDIDIIASFKTKNLNSYDTQCKKFFEIKDISFFYHQDGLYRTRCKKCCIKLEIERRQKNMNLYGDSYREYLFKVYRKWYYKGGGKEKVAKYMKEYHQRPEIKQRHRNASRKGMIRYRIRNKEVINAKMKYKRTLPSYVAWRRKYYEENKEKILAQQKTYRKKKSVTKEIL